MHSGFVTFKELQFLTGYSEQVLYKLIFAGLKVHELDPEYDIPGINEQDRKTELVFNLKEVEDWLKVHIF